jgi:glucose/arabinose dehydrogenase
VALANGYLYVDEGARIVRYKRGDGELAPSGAREVVVQNIPLMPGHRARNIAIGNDGALYVNVGSHSNSCQRRERTIESPGNDPCTELTRAPASGSSTRTRPARASRRGALRDGHSQRHGDDDQA